MIVVAGEALVDLIPDGAGHHRAFPGGSPLNVAVGLGRLGCEVTFVTELGDDPYGDLLSRHLGAAGVTAQIATVARTPRAVADLSGPEPAYALEVTWTLGRRALPACAALHVGSLAALTAPGRDAVLDLVRQAQRTRCLVSYDLNLRAEPDQDAARFVREIAAGADLVKLSEADADLFAPGSDPDAVARDFLGERTRLVVLTRGAVGTTAHTDRTEVSVSAPMVDVADTIGAGDAFSAGLLAALEAAAFAMPGRAEALRRLLAAAADVAALNCVRPGADPPWRTDLPLSWPHS